MSKADDKMKEIDFSKNEKGAILIRVNGTTLYLEKIIDGDTKVGEEPKEPIETRILAKLQFHQIESVNTVIEQLNKVKANLIYLSAC